MALFRTLPTPTNDLLPSLMVEVCLVLAPDVNFFLNSRKQGLPCWHCLSFFLSLRVGFESFEKMKPGSALLVLASLIQRKNHLITLLKIRNQKW